MKIKRTCKLPGEVVLGFGYGLAILLPLIALYLGVTYLASIYGTTISAMLVGFFQGLVAAIMDNLVLIFILFIAAVCTTCGWFEEAEEAGRDMKYRSKIIAGALLIAAIISGLVTLIVTSSMLTQQAYPNCQVCGMVWGFSWSYFIEGLLVIFGGFVAGWLLHWCKRCIRIEPDGEAPAGGENL